MNRKRQGDQPPPAIHLSEEQIRRGIVVFSDFVRQTRAHYLAASKPLTGPQKTALLGFFPEELLDAVRTVDSPDHRLLDPQCFKGARALGLRNLPDLAHVISMTFYDVIVFNHSATDRTLFHALVHAMQMHTLGIEWYSELFIRAFVRTGSHFGVPLESQAFGLEARFAAHPAKPFSVADIVRDSALYRRYE